MIEIVNAIVFNTFNKIIDFLPNFFGGLAIFIFGLFLATLLKKILVTFFNFIRLDELFQKTRLITKQEVKIWIEVLTEIVRWSIIILFLTPTLEVWNLSKATAVINQFILYLPNIIVAVVISFVGLVVSNLGRDVVKHSVKTIGSTSANTLAVFIKWLILFFTILIVLNQLGVAQDLVRILFTGIVVMVALAGGLAFGLGGKEIAKEMLEELRRKFK